MTTVDFLGYLAAACTTAAFVPQAVKVLRDKDTRSLSLGMYTLFTAGICIWLVYGVLKEDPAIVLANACTVILSVAILFVKVRFDVLPKLRKENGGGKVRITPLRAGGTERS